MNWRWKSFLPVFIAVAGAKYCKCNPYIALWCCLALTNPTWSSIAATIAEGTPLHFLFVPLTIMVIGPISTLFANGLANAYNWLYKVLPWLASGILGALWQVLVVFGVHWSFTPISVANYANLGYDLLQPCQGIAVCAQTAACFGVFWKTRSSKIKNAAGSAAATGLFGITEPSIYGITLRFKKPFICGCIGAAAGAITASFFKARYFVFAGLSGFLSIPNAIYNSSAAANCESLGTAGNYSSSITGVLIGTVVACAVAFILVQIVGFDDPIDAEEVPQPKTSHPQTSQPSAADISTSAESTGFTVYAPLSGEIKELKDVPDETFAGGMLGQGIAVIPAEGNLYAPVDCIVDSVFETKHAIGLSGPDGSEILIHVGLETVTLGGKYFNPVVKAGDKVKAGDLLMEFDLDAISRQFKTITPILVTNAEDYAAVTPVRVSGRVKVGEPLYTVK